MLADQRDFFHVESLALLLQQEVFHSPIGFQFFGASHDGSENASKRKPKSKNPKKQKQRGSDCAAACPRNLFRRL
jgi:hypothetical protein